MGILEVSGLMWLIAAFGRAVALRGIAAWTFVVGGLLWGFGFGAAVGWILQAGPLAATSADSVVAPAPRGVLLVGCLSMFVACVLCGGSLVSRRRLGAAARTGSEASPVATWFWKAMVVGVPVGVATSSLLAEGSTNRWLPILLLVACTPIVVFTVGSTLERLDDAKADRDR